MFLISEALAQDAVPAVPPQGDGMGSFVLIFAVLALFYFIIIRPQNKRIKAQKEMLDALKKGDEIITSGGLIGTVTKLIDEKEIEVEISKGIKVRALRHTIQQRSTEANDNKAEDAKKAPKKKSASKETKAADKKKPEDDKKKA